MRTFFQRQLTRKLYLTRKPQNQTTKLAGNWLLNFWKQINPTHVPTCGLPRQVHELHVVIEPPRKRHQPHQPRLQGDVLLHLQNLVLEAHDFSLLDGQTVNRLCHLLVNLHDALVCAQHSLARHRDSSRVAALVANQPSDLALDLRPRARKLR